MKTFQYQKDHKNSMKHCKFYIADVSKVPFSTKSGCGGLKAYNNNNIDIIIKTLGLPQRFFIPNSVYHEV